MNDNHIYIDENIIVSTGNQAKDMLSKNNDKKYYSSNGIVSVPIERWQIAQSTEFKHWMKKGLKSRNDHNDIRLKNFYYYSVLRDMSFERAIELGCGPFTNLRLIANFCKINHCTLMDPLIKEYLNHPNCSYDENTLSIESEFLHKIEHTLNIFRVGKYSPLMFSYRILRKLYTKVPKSLHRTIPVEIIQSSLEDLSIDKQYDLVVIINVLEHCYDVQICLSKINKLLKPGGIIVFADKVFSATTITKLAEKTYDATHPIKIAKPLIYQFLQNNFECLYSNNIAVECLFANTFAHDKFPFTLIHFIGRKIN